VEAARQVDEHTQISMRIVQPWGEYLSQTKNRLSPIQFVDTLRRCGVRIAEVNLDIRVGAIPGQTLWRDSLSLSQLLDQWSLLQVPMNVMLTLPTAPSPNAISDPMQSEWLRQTILMCLSKERVVGIYCSNWDETNDTTGLTSMIDAKGVPRPALSAVEDIFDQFWS
jgi:hypothetical protein